jgi:hypothetical protein
VRRGGAAWWSEGAVAVVVGRVVVVLVVAGVVIGGITERVVAATGALTRGEGSRAESESFGAHPNVAASETANTAPARNVTCRGFIGISRRRCPGRNSLATGGTVLRVSGDSSIL